MKINLRKNFVCLTAITLLFATLLSPPLATQASNINLDDSLIDEEYNISPALQDELKKEIEILQANDPDLTKEEIEKYTKEFVESQNEIKPMAIPLLVNLAVRAYATYTARTSAGVIVSLTSHSTYRMVNRAISSYNMNRVLVNGARYRDTVTNARVVMHNGTTVILDPKKNKVVTTYLNYTIKNQWKPEFWFY